MANKIPHILIVDDDANLLATTSDILKMKGFEPFSAQTGGMALAQIEKHSFDLALIDLRLEDMSGLKVLRGIKARSPETECILLTGHATRNSAIEAIQMGVYGFFQKPFDMEQVLLSIRRAVEKSAAGKALLESERFAHATVDALSSHLAILDETGAILAVNRAWREFAEANSSGTPNLNLYEGANYLSVCETSKGISSEEASAMGAGIRAVMSGRQKEFSLEYPCHSPNEKRWFNARVTRFSGEGALRIVVAHENITERKQAEEKVARSHDLLANLARLVPGVIYQYRLYPDGRSAFPYSSPGMNDIYEVTPEEVREDATPVFGRLHPDDYDRVGDTIQESARTLQTFYCEFRVILPRQGLRWRWSQAYPERMEDGGALWHGIISDITERKRAEEALRESEARFRWLAENAPDVIFRVRLAPAWGVEYISPAVTALAGYTPEEYYADPRLALKLINPDDASVFQPVLADRGAPGVPMVMRLVTRDGAIRWTEQRTVPVYDAAGQLIALEGIARDITERKQIEADLQMRAQLLDAAEDSIFLLDVQGQITYANRAAWASRGYTRDELLQLNIRDLVTVAEQAEIAPHIAALRQEGARRFEAQHRRKDGAVFPVDVRAQLVNVDGVPMLLAAVTDSSQQQQAQADIRRALARERELGDLKSQFISTTSHEFRTPLSTIFTSSELIEHYGARWPAAKQLYYLRLIQQSCLLMTELLDDLLTIGHAEAGKLTCNPVPLDLMALCHSLVAEVQLIAGDGHVVTFSRVGECPTARLDERLLRQILTNLLSNAIKYSPNGGEVRLELTCAPAQVEFRVQDHGLGIPLEAQPQLFDLFYRAPNVGDIRGTGLGLRIVKRAVELHGGTIQCTSEVGAGTTFVVTLPLAA